MASIEEAKEIIKGSSISTVVSFYHPISKKGANYEGICPFHADSHPSMKVNDDKGIYKCFACGAAGDSIKFVQDKLNLEFVEAVKDISEKLGITIDEQSNKRSDPKYDMALRVLQVAAKLYKKVAKEIKPENYSDFLKNRNLNDESVVNFHIGYAPANNALVNYLSTIAEKERDFAISVAKQIGLIGDNKHGEGYYDFYRDRIMFPISDHSGKTRGFSSRAVLPKQKPKYLNSGESFVFDKGNILYGFELAKSHIREQGVTIVAEGNMDVIALHQYGFKNSVATMGVSLSQNSIRLLSNINKNIILGMDSDDAGIKAMTRINADFLKIGVIPKYLDYSPSKDPDEFLNEFGRLELIKRIEDAPSFLDFIINKTIPESIPEGTNQKLTLLEQIFQFLMPLGEDLFAYEKAINIAKSLGLKSGNDDITDAYKTFLKKNQPKSHAAAKKFTEPEIPIPDNNYAPQEVEAPQQVESTKIAKTELNVLKDLIKHPECILAPQIAEILDLTLHFEVKRIVQWLKKIYLEIDETDYASFITEKMNEAIPTTVKTVMASSLFGHTNLKLEQRVIDKMLNDHVLNLKIEALLSEKRQIIMEQKSCSSDEDSNKLLNKVQEIETKLKELKHK